MARLVAFAKQVAARSKFDAVGDVAASLAYWTFLSIFPAAIAFVSVLGWMEVFLGKSKTDEIISDVIEKIDEWFSGSSFRQIRDTIVDILTTPRTGLAIVGVLTALWTISKGFATLCRALARIHGLPTRRLGIEGRILGLVLGAGTIAIASVATAAFALGPLFGLVETNGRGQLLWNLIDTPLALAVALVWLTVVLKVGPGLPGPLRRFLPGALVAAGLIVAIVAGSLLVLNLGLLGANPVFGALGGVILVLTMLNFLSRSVLIGAEVNAVRFEHVPMPTDVHDTAPAEPTEPTTAVVPGPGALAAAYGLLAAAVLRRHR